MKQFWHTVRTWIVGTPPLTQVEVWRKIIGTEVRS